MEEQADLLRYVAERVEEEIHAILEPHLATEYPGNAIHKGTNERHFQESGWGKYSREIIALT